MTDAKRVPREPDAAMFIAGTKALAAANEGFARRVWYAMHDAAPEGAPAPGYTHSPEWLADHPGASEYAAPAEPFRHIMTMDEIAAAERPAPAEPPAATHGPDAPGCGNMRPEWAAPQSDIAGRITAYLCGGGLFNPELANHDAVRDLLIDCRAALARVSANLAAHQRNRVDLTEALNAAEAKLARVSAERDAEREAHAQLQARCFDYGGTGQNVFDDLAEARRQLEAAQADAARVDWMQRQDLDELRFSIPIDRPHDGEYEVCWWDEGQQASYGATFRAAIDAAIAKGVACGP